MVNRSLLILSLLLHLVALHVYRVGGGASLFIVSVCVLFV